MTRLFGWPTDGPPAGQSTDLALPVAQKTPGPSLPERRFHHRTCKLRNSIFPTLVAVLLAPSISVAATLTLTAVDSITINGSGTSGTIGGLPFNNGTTRYVTGTADQNGAIQVTAITLAGNANLKIGPGAEVTDNIAAPPTNGGIAISSRSSGKISITGGLMRGGPADRSSGAALSLGGTGPVFISGGDLIGGNSGLGLENFGSGAVWILGGHFSTNPVPGGVSIYTTGFFNTTTNQREPGGVVNILGGQIEGSVAGLRWGLVANPLGTIALFSQNETPFLVNGVPMNHQTIPSMPGTNTISGTLYNGDVLDTTFYNQSGGVIRLNVGVPEPSATLLLASGVLALVRLRTNSRSPRRPSRF